MTTQINKVDGKIKTIVLINEKDQKTLKAKLTNQPIASNEQLEGLVVEQSHIIGVLADTDKNGPSLPNLRSIQLSETTFSAAELIQMLKMAKLEQHQISIKLCHIKWENQEQLRELDELLKNRLLNGRSLPTNKNELFDVTSLSPVTQNPLTATPFLNSTTSRRADDKSFTVSTGRSTVAHKHDARDKDSITKVLREELLTKIPEKAKLQAAMTEALKKYNTLIKTRSTDARNGELVVNKDEIVLQNENKKPLLTAKLDHTEVHEAFLESKLLTPNQKAIIILASLGLPPSPDSKEKLPEKLTISPEIPGDPVQDAVRSEYEKIKRPPENTFTVRLSS